MLKSNWLKLFLFVQREFMIGKENLLKELSLLDICHYHSNVLLISQRAYLINHCHDANFCEIWYSLKGHWKSHKVFLGQLLFSLFDFAESYYDWYWEKLFYRIYFLIFILNCWNSEWLITLWRHMFYTITLTLKIIAFFL